MKVVTNADLTPYNSYRIRTGCARAFFPDNEDDLRAAYETDPEVPKVQLGSGHNVVFAREFYDNDFIILNGTFSQIEVEGSEMEVQAGAFSARMSEVAWEHGLSGLEFLYDIPSSLGGAIVMNAGASGEEIKDLVVSIRYLDLGDGSFREISGEEARFSYRNSIFQRDADKIVVSARLRLRPEERNVIRAKMDAFKTARWAKQPRDLPNAGSVFKRPPGRFVGPMVEALGLKGFRVGDAMVSTKHGGIIVNVGSARGTDVVRVIDHVRERVAAEFGVTLEIEQRIME